MKSQREDTLFVMTCKDGIGYGEVRNVTPF